jgi:tetratricopeptide (TPR) repeat protein
MATTNSAMSLANFGKWGIGSWRQSGIPFLLALSLLAFKPTLNASAEKDAERLRLMRWLANSEKAYLPVKESFTTNRNDFETCWKMARACFDMAEYATNSSQRVAFGTEGIAAAKQAIALKPESGVAHYYLGLTIGQVARVKRFSALHLVDEMEGELLKALRLDQNVDNAGPDRSLGLLYRDAPGWPISVGSKDKAMYHLARAVRLAKDHPDNQLSLLEAYVRWADKKTITNYLTNVEAVFKKAKAAPPGPNAEADWFDWDLRMKQIREKLGLKPEP